MNQEWFAEQIAEMIEAVMTAQINETAAMVQAKRDVVAGQMLAWSWIAEQQIDCGRTE